MTREILLKPYTEILSEKWLFDNERALSSVKLGLRQSFNKKTVYNDSFAEFIEDNK